MSFDTPFRKCTILLQVLQGENANSHARSCYVCTCLCLFVERTEQEENIQIKEYQDHIQQLREAYESQGEKYQQLYLQHQETLKVWFLRQLHLQHFNF